MSEERLETFPKPYSGEGLLPDKPSDLIELALADLEKVEAQRDRYAVDMGVWVCPARVYDDEGIVHEGCLVCLAGAVMVSTLHVAENRYVEPNHFDDASDRKLQAIDNFRAGRVLSGLARMNVDLNKLKNEFPEEYCLLDDRSIPYYGNEQDEAFKNAMRRLVNDLRQVGL